MNDDFLLDVLVYVHGPHHANELLTSKLSMHQPCPLRWQVHVPTKEDDMRPMNRQDYNAMPLQQRAAYVAEVLSQQVETHHIRALVNKQLGEKYKVKEFAYGGTIALRPHANRIDEFLTPMTDLADLNISVNGFDSETVNRIWNTVLENHGLDNHGRGFVHGMGSIHGEEFDALHNPTPIETYDMNAALISNVTLFRGRNIKDLSSDDLIGAIKALKKEAADLTDLGVTSTAIDKRQLEINAALTVIVAQLDASVS